MTISPIYKKVPTGLKVTLEAREMEYLSNLIYNINDSGTILFIDVDSEQYDLGEAELILDDIVKKAKETASEIKESVDIQIDLDRKDIEFLKELYIDYIDVDFMERIKVTRPDGKKPKVKRLKKILNKAIDRYEEALANCTE